MNRYQLALTVVSLFTFGTSTQAGLIEFTAQMVPDFELTLNPALTQLPTPVTFAGTADGSVNFVFDLNTSAETLDFVSVGGSFQGSLADPDMTTFDLLITGLDTGTATNVSVAGGRPDQRGFGVLALLPNVANEWSAGSRKRHS